MTPSDADAKKGLASPQARFPTPMISSQYFSVKERYRTCHGPRKRAFRIKTASIPRPISPASSLDSSTAGPCARSTISCPGPLPCTKTPAPRPDNTANRAANDHRLGSIAPSFHGLPTNRSHRVTARTDCPAIVDHCKAGGQTLISRRCSALGAGGSGDNIGQSLLVSRSSLASVAIVKKRKENILPGLRFIFDLTSPLHKAGNNDNAPRFDG